MLKRITKKKSLLLTAAVLAAMSVPAYAAEKKPEDGKAIITREDIDKMGAESVRQALQLAIGLDLKENTMVGSSVSIRGANTNQTLILIDGRRVRTEDTGSTMNFYELDRVNMDDVERIEIVRGAASSLYGSEALGGVINIIRKKADEQKTSATADWTSRRNDVGVRFDTGKQGKWNISTSFKRSDYRERGTHMYGKKYFFNIEGRMDVAQDKWLDVFADYLGEDLQAKESRVQSADYDNVRVSTGIKYAGRDKRGDYEAQVYYTHFHKEQERRNRGNRKLLGFDDMTFDSLIFDGKRSMQLTKDHLLTFGGEYRKEDYASTRIKGNESVSYLSREGITQRLGKSSVNYAALYVQDEWLVHPDWLLIPSLRWDHSSSFGDKVTGKLGTTYKINKDLRFKANIGTAYRAPTASELYLDWAGMPASGMLPPGWVFWLQGNPDLKPETALNFDLGFEWEKGKTFSKITYFHNKIDDMLTSIPKIDRMKKIYKMVQVNKKEATMQGLEFEAKQEMGDGFAVRGLYTYLDARDGKDNRIDGRAYHKVSLQLSYDDEKNGWNATLWNDWISGYYLDKKNYADSVLNLVVNKKINDHCSAYLGIDNILDRESVEFAHDGRIWRGGVNMTF